MEYPILQPDPGIFEGGTEVQRILAERSAVFLTERIEYPSEGIYRFNLGCMFPEKGFPTPERIACVNMAKRVTLSFVMPLASKEMLLPLLGFCFLGSKSKIRLIEKTLTHYLRTTEQILSPCFLKEQRYCVFCRELRIFLRSFLTELGISLDISDRVAKVFVTLIEYDNAYRLRIEDLLYESSKQKLQNPREEILRIISIFRERETGYSTNGISVGDRFLAFGQLLSLILLVPKIKKAFLKALKDVNFQNLQMDEADSYFCLLRTDYKFFGESIEKRILRWYEVHNNKLPPQILVNG